MKSAVPFYHKPRIAGMTLVIALAIIALLSIVVMAFFSQVTSNRLVEASRAKRAETDVLARSAGDYVEGLFLREIADPANSKLNTTNATTIYTPLARANILPARTLAPAISTTNSDFYNLLRQSVPASDTNASSDNTATPAKNGRVVNATRWNMPALLSGSGFTITDQLPYWIYITGSGVTNAASSETIGHFSYNVYDIGGLLNANVAGYPGTLSASQIAQLKSTVAGADMTQLPGIKQAAVNALISFRNPGATDAASYLKNNAAARSSGFLPDVTTSATTPSVTSSNSYFTSRQDLLRYARTQNTAFANAMPYLTHFSRSLSAPAWGPVNPPGSTTDYASKADTATSTNRNLPNVRFSSDGLILHYYDDGTSHSYPVTKGQPLLQYRFSLTKLAWLTYKGPSADLATSDSLYNAGGTDTAIQACFGLKWNTNQDRWDYYGSTGSTLVTSIETLDTVTSENREPNFFEVIKAGVLDNSIGLTSQATTLAAAGQQALDAAKDLQILRIGANIIDCSDSDNYPTIISLNVGGTQIEIAGVEDLPYFHSLWMTGLQRWNASNTQVTDCDIIWFPTLINPHRPSLSTATASPDSVTVDIANGTLTHVFDNNNNFAQNNMTKGLAGAPSITIPKTTANLSGAQLAFEDFRNGPQAMRNTSAANRLGNLVSYATADGDKQGFLIFSYENTSDYTGAWPASNPTGTLVHNPPTLQAQFTGLMLRLQYPAPSGRMKTYATLSGNEALPTTTGLLATNGYVMFTSAFNFASPANVTSLTGGSRAVLWDPRTNRLGPGLSIYCAIANLPALSGNNDRIGLGSPFNDSNATDKTNYPTFTALWPQGGKTRDLTTTIKTPGWFTNLPDSDGLYRPADGWLGNAANPYRQTSSGALSTTDASRPILLQRPYQSVAELGYVFRDIPWKTLSFFDETSGDGALLDLFSVADEPAVTAGRVNLNTRQSTIRQALFSQAAQEPDGSSPLGVAAGLATACDSYTFASGAATATLPWNVAQLCNFMSSAQLSSAIPAATTPLKSHREAVVRAVADTAQTRTWNLFIDIVAQCGHGSTGPSFVVEGEQRYWISVAIDRYTGKIVDKQLEPVNE
ncbi:MAG: hypothetical protein ACFUZC_08505 [Chthoniobacteraceae bacterium]